jgi:hypothetical protein
VKTALSNFKCTEKEIIYNYKACTVRSFQNFHESELELNSVSDSITGFLDFVHRLVQCPATSFYPRHTQI